MLTTQHDIKNSPEHGSRFSNLLRGLGAIAIVISGLTYMLQGLYQTNTDLRNWVCLALIFSLGAGGVFALRLMQDKKGARLFFALGTLLVPVQFSQLGGMILHYIAGEQMLHNLFTITAPSSTTLIAVGLLSLVLCICMCYAGFSVLCRAYAKHLTVSFVLMNLALLLPFREGFILFALITVFIGALWQLEQRLYRDALFTTQEGLAARLMMLLPIFILTSRAAFHFSDTMGISVLLLCGAVATCYSANARLNTAYSSVAQLWWNELLIALGFLSVMIALPGLSREIFFSQNAILPLANNMSGLAYGLPIFFCTLHLSRYGKAGALIYRLVAILALAFSAISLTSVQNELSSFLLMLSSVYLTAFGFLNRQKISFVCGVLFTIAICVDLIFAGLRDMTLNVWLVFAIFGLLMVTLSSVLEKHGKRWLALGKDYWQQFNEWEAR